MAESRYSPGSEELTGSDFIPNVSAFIDDGSLHRNFGENVARGLVPVILNFLSATGELKTLQSLITDPSLDLSMGDYDNRTPLHLAAQQGRLDIVKLLVERGARLNCVDKFGATPLRCAISGNHPEIVDFLKSKGATVYLDAFSDMVVLENMQGISEMELEQLRVIFNSIDKRKPENENSVSAESVRAWLKKNAGFRFKLHKNALTELTAVVSKGESVSWKKFVATMRKPGSLIARAFKDQLAIRRWPTFCDTVHELLIRVKDSVTGGKQASYIPELGNADPNLFGVAVCTVDGQLFSCGDMDDFPLQAAANPLLYSLLVERLGYDAVHNHIGKEPSGGDFNAFSLNSQNKPHNACVNTGAIVACSMFESQRPASERFRLLLSGVSELAGAKLGFSQAVYLSEKSTAMRNYALAHYMASQGALPKSTKIINESLDFWTQLCSIEGNCESLATIAATYANNGVNPLNGSRVLQQSTTKQTIAMLYSCGMYNASGEWACNVGLPSKSGISGCIWLVVPGVAGIAVYAPPVDVHGTSIRGAAISQAIADRFSWHIFDVLHAIVN